MYKMLLCCLLVLFGCTGCLAQTRTATSQTDVPTAPGGSLFGEAPARAQGGLLGGGLDHTPSTRPLTKRKPKQPRQAKKAKKKPRASSVASDLKESIIPLGVVGLLATPVMGNIVAAVGSSDEDTLRLWGVFGLIVGIPAGLIAVVVVATIASFWKGHTLAQGLMGFLAAFIALPVLAYAGLLIGFGTYNLSKANDLAHSQSPLTGRNTITMPLLQGRF